MARALLGLALVALVAAATAAGAQSHPRFEASRSLQAPRAEILSDAPTPLFGGEVLDREALAAAVLERNPSLAAARQAWEAARQGIPQAGSLADPTASWAVAPLSLASSGVRFGQTARLSQGLPFPGVLSARRAAASAEADAAAGRLAETRLELVTAALHLYDDLYLAERGLEIHREHLSLLADLRRTATRHYEAGLVAQQVPLQAEVEETRVLHREVVLTAQRKVLAAALNALLHRPPDAPLPRTPSQLEAPPAPPAPLPEMLSRALDARPELSVLAARVRAREHLLELRRLERYPDFEATTQLNSMWSQREHRWTVGVGVNVPVYRKRLRAGIAESEARLAAANSEREALEDRVLAEVAQAHARIEEAYHRVELHQSRLLPASRDQIRAALAGFRTGRTSFLAVIDAERTERAVQLEYHGALADYHRARADLARAVGVEATGVSGAASATSSTGHNPPTRGDQP